jgi:sugar transferase (PEP-CTERM/EpsH1 system associated)
LVAHVIQRLATGGLENGLINLINHMSRDRYRHAIICLNESTSFAERIRSKDVAIVQLGHTGKSDLSLHRLLMHALRSLKPQVLHTRNLPCLEFAFSGALAGVPGRVHGEHGRDIYDLDGANLRYNLLRKATRPIVHRYIAMSRDLANWLKTKVKVRSARVVQIYNGVDTGRFRPREAGRAVSAPNGFLPSNGVVVGTVGRMETVKDQLTLVQAFLHIIQRDRVARERMRLMIVGDGSLRQSAIELLRKGGAEKWAWLPGEREDVPELMQAMDLFVLPSLREGISNTILEAMATGLPVIATDVGGNPELVEPGKTGELVPHSDPIALAAAIQGYFRDPDGRVLQGRAGRQRAVECFSLEAMVKGYLDTYDAVMNESAPRGVLPRFLLTRGALNRPDRSR